MPFDKKRFIIYGDVVNGAFHKRIIKQVNNITGSDLYFHHVNLTKWGDGEQNDHLIGWEKIKDNVVVFFYSVTSDDLLIRFLQQVWGAKYQYGAKRVLVFLDFMRYRRQDHREVEYMREINRNRWFLENMKWNGIDDIIFVEIHNKLTLTDASDLGMNVYHVEAVNSFVPYLKSIIEESGIENVIIRSVDKGGIPRAIAYARALGVKKISLGDKVRVAAETNHKKNVDNGIIVKLQKEYPNLEFLFLEKFDGLTIIIPEDEVSTGGSANKGSIELKENGAAKIILCAAHQVSTGPWKEVLFKNNPFYRVLLGNTIELTQENKTGGLVTHVDMSLESANKLIEALNYITENVLK